MNTRAYLAELLGTFLFLTIGYLSVAALGAADANGLLVVPFAFGFGLLAAIFAFGHISGGHYNPAVTVATVLDRRTAADRRSRVHRGAGRRRPRARRLSSWSRPARMRSRPASIGPVAVSPTSGR